jgi:hypothetical protein
MHVIKFKEACIRCPMLGMSPAQLPRLLHIETNTRERLDEAPRMRWGGEFAALDESLRHTEGKKATGRSPPCAAERGEAGADVLG